MIVDWVGVSFLRVTIVIASVSFAAEDRQHVIERGIHPPEAANVGPVIGGAVGEVGVKGAGWLGFIVASVVD